MATFGVTLPQFPDEVRMAKSPVVAPVNEIETEAAAVALAGVFAVMAVALVATTLVNVMLPCCTESVPPLFLTQST
jgi:hypothetical protein